MDRRILYVAKCVEYVGEQREVHILGAFTHEADAETAFTACNVQESRHLCVDGIHDVRPLEIDKLDVYGWY